MLDTESEILKQVQDDDIGVQDEDFGVKNKAGMINDADFGSQNSEGRS